MSGKNRRGANPTNTYQLRSSQLRSITSATSSVPVTTTTTLVRTTSVPTLAIDSATVVPSLTTTFASVSGSQVNAPITSLLSSQPAQHFASPVQAVLQPQFTISTAPSHHPHPALPSLVTLAY